MICYVCKTEKETWPHRGDLQPICLRCLVENLGAEREDRLRRCGPIELEDEPEDDPNVDSAG